MARAAADFNARPEVDRLRRPHTTTCRTYVRVLLASDVVNGNTANATFQGAAAGQTLAAGSSSTVLGELVGKWFLGSDLPVVSSSGFTYTTANGSLFTTTPSHNDEFQGELGDCYFISSLGMIADNNPQAIKNMFIDNGDGTFTVRFYGGQYGASYGTNGAISDGFASGKGTADYVTVNRSLVTFTGSGGMLAYADCGEYASSSTASLWIPLAEKAYAEWNQTGNEGRDGTNNYSSIEGGWMAAVSSQVLGYNASDYSLTASTQQTMINALANHQAVTIGTDGSSNANDTLQYGLYGSHAYGVIGYNASAGTFTLYNPWGMDQPQPMTWADLEATTDGFVVANPANSVPMSGSLKAGKVSAAVGANSASAAAIARWSASSAPGPTATAAASGLSPAAVDALFASGGV